MIVLFGYFIGINLFYQVIQQVGNKLLQPSVSFLHQVTEHPSLSQNTAQAQQLLETVQASALFSKYVIILYSIILAFIMIQIYNIACPCSNISIMKLKTNSEDQHFYSDRFIENVLKFLFIHILLSLSHCVCCTLNLYFAEIYLNGMSYIWG